MHPEFLIDANCLMTPNNDYYRPDFRLSQQFWEHLQQLVMNGGIGVISQVAHEVAVGSGSGHWLDEWLLSIQSEIIEPGSDSSIVAKFGEVMNYVATPNLFSQRAQQSWMRDGVADPWLVATATVYGSKIITFEKYVAQTPNQPAGGAKIPNVARHFGVECISLFDFMAKEGNF